MKCICGKKFFDRNTLVVARELLGKFLVRKYRGSTSSPQAEIAAMITDVEAYDGFKDKASHASRGMTARNAPMFGSAGNWYVYFTYGMHWMLNVVTREKGYPAAILIRGISVIPAKAGIQRANQLLDSRFRGNDSGSLVINGPARLTKYFHIDKRFNAKPASRKTGLWIEDRGVHISPSQIKKSPRIGVDYAGSVWAGKKWRFFSASMFAPGWSSCTWRQCSLHRRRRAREESPPCRFPR